MQVKLLLLPSPLRMSFKIRLGRPPLSAFSSEQERKEKKRNSVPEIWRFWRSQSPVRVNRELELSEEEGFLVLLLYICFCRWEHGRRLFSTYYCAVRFVLLRQWIDSVVVVAVVAAERPTRKKERKKRKGQVAALLYYDDKDTTQRKPFKTWSRRAFYNLKRKNKMVHFFSIF